MLKINGFHHLKNMGKNRTKIEQKNKIKKFKIGKKDQNKFKIEKKIKTSSKLKKRSKQVQN